MKHNGRAFSRQELNKKRLRPGTKLQVACLVQVRGDSEWYAAGFRCRSQSSRQCCYLCDATLDDCYDMRETGPHRRTCKSHIQFLAECCRDMRQVSTLFRLPGLKLWHFTVDGMHTYDLGPLLDILASVLYVEQTWRPVCLNMAVGLQTINAELQTYGRAVPELTQTHLTQSMITPQDSKYPILIATAAQARHLVGYVRQLAYRQVGYVDRPPIVLRGAMTAHAAQYRRLVVQLCDALSACLIRSTRSHLMWRPVGARS